MTKCPECKGNNFEPILYLDKAIRCKCKDCDEIFVISRRAYERRAYERRAYERRCDLPMDRINEKANKEREKMINVVCKNCNETSIFEEDLGYKCIIQCKNCKAIGIYLPYSNSANIGSLVLQMVCRCGEKLEGDAIQRCPKCGKMVDYKKEIKYQEKNEKLHLFLSNNEFYDENIKLSICPVCYKYSVKYVEISKRWYCSTCYTYDIYHDYDLNYLKLSDKCKFQIYNNWSLHAIKDLTGEPLYVIQNFIASYFKDCCISKDAKCTYFDTLSNASIDNMKASIDNMFSGVTNRYIKSSTDIEYYLAVIRRRSHSFSDEKRKEVLNRCVTLEQIVESLTQLSGNCYIATADVDLNKDEIVYVRKSNGDLIANLDPKNGMAYFSWNDAKKGDMIGIANLRPYVLKDLRIVLRKLLNDSLSYSMEILSPIEKRTMSVIMSKRGLSIGQYLLRDDINVNEKECSEIIESLVKKGLIAKYVYPGTCLPKSLNIIGLDLRTIKDD